MCDCLSFLVYPNVSQRLASWKREFLHLIDWIASYHGPFTDLEVHRVSFSGRFTTTYSATGARVQVTLTMGSCLSTSSSSKILSAPTSSISSGKHKPKHTPSSDPSSTQPVAAAPGQNKRAKGLMSRQDSDRITATSSAQDKERRSPKKISINGASNVACLFTQQGRKGLNQDAMIVWEGFNPQEDAVFCGIFDGHGPYGHLVAQLVRDTLPPKLTCKWKYPHADDGREPTSKDRETPDADRDRNSMWKEAFLDAYMLMDKELRGRPNLDCFCSGTTAVTLIKQGSDVYIGYVGDSRAILGTKLDDGSFKAVQLTVDLKPNLPEEAERIRQCRGRVFALQDEPEVHRVWLPHDNSPGLAMARAFGDFCLKNFGVIAVPQLAHRRLIHKDQFIVLATDGIWDVLSNEQVVNIVASVSARPFAAKAVVETAVHEWKTKYPTSKVDDCAVVCLFLKDMMEVLPNQNLKKRRGASQLKPQLLVPATVPQQKYKSTGDSSTEALKKTVEPPTVVSIIKAGNKNQSSTSAGELDDSSIPEATCKIEDSTKTGKYPEGVQDRAQNYLGIGETPIDSVLGDEEWTALDGVTRVNSLVNLPRFTVNDARAGG